MKALILCGLMCSGCAFYRSTVEVGFEQNEQLKAHSGTWELVTLPDAPTPTHALMQTASSPADAFNLALREGETPSDADVHLKLRAVAGELDQGGGLVFRARDDRNYYVARWNPLEHNLRAYKVVDGVRTQLASADIEAGPGWHTLRVWFRHDKYEAWFDGKSRFEFQDRTFTGNGMIGLWTKADARTQFDDLWVWELNQ